jgi:REP-associated tyrosine transposase
VTARFHRRQATFLLKRMAKPQRLRWLFSENPIYYITACTYNRRRILDHSVVHDSFIQFGLCAARRQVWVGRYVMMPDHIHMFVGFAPQSMSISKWMKSFKNAISKTLTNATFAAPHWQKNFFDHVIRSEESYDQQWSYVRENPVRAGLVRAADDWPFAGELHELRF